MKNRTFVWMKNDDGDVYVDVSQVIAVSEREEGSVILLKGGSNLRVVQEAEEAFRRVEEALHPGREPREDLTGFSAVELVDTYTQRVGRKQAVVMELLSHREMDTVPECTCGFKAVGGFGSNEVIHHIADKVLSVLGEGS